MDINNWQRRETIGATNSTAIVTRYYAYTNAVNSGDTDAVFSIKKVTVSGTVETVNWSDNSIFSYTAKWSERAANFTAPSGALGFTYSGSNPTTFTWTRLSGVNTYNIVVRDNNGYMVDQYGLSIPNSQQSVTECYYNTTSHNQYLNLAGTYSVVLQAVNAGGTLTATYSVVI